MITIPLYDYSGENYKESLHPISAEVENKGGNLTFELSAEASDYWSGGITLGDRLLAPYPWQIGMGEWFRICKIAAENSTVTIKAAHLTEDILSTYCSVDTSGSFTLHEFVTDILQDPAFLTNSGDIEFDWFYHDEDDERYEQTHECNIKAMDGAGILQHIASVFGCNFIRHENKIVLTYGSASDYFRDLYGLIPFSGSFRKGRNVVGLASEDSNEDLITAILPTVKVTINEIETQNAGAPVVNTDFAALYGRAEALKRLKKVEYNPNVERNEGESDLDYARRVVAAAQGEAQTEVDSYNTDTQSISIEISARDGERLFGGEIGTCIDADMRQSFDLVIEGFSLDLMRGVYYDIELGRVGASLADLAGGRGAGGLSGGGISSATLTAIYSAIGDAKSTAQGAAGTAATALSTAQTAQTTANAAKATAQTAQTTANAAKATAQTAQTTANAAKATADNALPLSAGSSKPLTGPLYAKNAVFQGTVKIARNNAIAELDMSVNNGATYIPMIRLNTDGTMRYGKSDIPAIFDQELRLNGEIHSASGLKVTDVRNGTTYQSIKGSSVGSGYVTLPWGMILMWGYSAGVVSSGTVDVNPAIYCKTILCAVGNPANSAFQCVIIPAVFSENKIRFIISNTDGTTPTQCPFRWMAIGY